MCDICIKSHIYYNANNTNENILPNMSVKTLHCFYILFDHSENTALPNTLKDNKMHIIDLKGMEAVKE